MPDPIEERDAYRHMDLVAAALAAAVIGRRAPPPSSPEEVRKVFRDIRAEVFPHSLTAIDQRAYEDRKAKGDTKF
jgi:hypothetical protein